MKPTNENVFSPEEIIEFYGVDGEGRIFRKRDGRRVDTVRDGEYRAVVIDSVKLKAHRIAWVLYHGVWPMKYIDHINGDALDNRETNLREVTAAQNSRNKSFRPKPHIPHIGVYKRTDWARKKPWVATIGYNYKVYNLGTYATCAEAIFARKCAELRFGYHENHGRIAA